MGSAWDAAPYKIKVPVVLQKILVRIGNNNGVIWEMIGINPGNFFVIFNGCYLVFIAPKFPIAANPSV